MFRAYKSLLPASAALLIAACAPKEPPPEVEAPRPVTVLELRETDPVQPQLVTGAVKSWKEQDVSFEVGGVVRFIVEAGTNLEGQWIEDGEVQLEGDVLALLDQRTYETARNQATAALSVAREQVRTAQVQLEKVLPANLKAAAAERDRAQAEFVRYEQAAETEAVSGIDVIRAQADRDAKLAYHEQTLAAIDAKGAEIRSLEASVEAAQEDLEQATYDLERCTLQAPFSGEVSEVFIEAGGYAERGEPVAHLVMMTPIKVDLAVSSDTARVLRRGDVVRLYLPGLEEEPAYGRVYERATAADPETRTFRISIITLNQELGTAFAADDPRSSLPRIEEVMPLMRGMRKPFLDSYGVEARRALRQDEDGYYVWADPVRTVHDSIPDGTILTLRKVRVTPGPSRHNLQGIYLMQELTDVGELQDGQLIGLDVPDSDAEEQSVVVDRPQWRLRPGQLVSVLLADEAPAPGLYVPMDAIRPIDASRGVVFLAEDGRAKELEVRILGNVGPLFRIEAEGLAPGAQVITDFIHFLLDGEPVRVARRRGAGS